jgi:hypothetical protein
MLAFASSLLVVVCSACSASNPAATPEQQFLGTWSFASGDDNIVCPNGTTAQKLSGKITVEVASGGGLAVLDQAGCNFSYSLSGHQATLGANKSCSFAVPQLGQGATADVTYDSITLVTDDGESMSDVFGGKAHYTTPSGAEDCAFSGSATLSKVTS